MVVKPLARQKQQISVLPLPLSLSFLLIILKHASLLFVLPEVNILDQFSPGFNPSTQVSATFVKAAVYTYTYNQQQHIFSSFMSWRTLWEPKWHAATQTGDFFTFFYCVQNTVICCSFEITHIAIKNYMTVSTSSHCSDIIVNAHGTCTGTDENLISSIITHNYKHLFIPGLQRNYVSLQTRKLHQKNQQVKGGDSPPSSPLAWDPIWSIHSAYVSKSTYILPLILVSSSKRYFFSWKKTTG